ncbi:TfoX/Sxy family DNA transformation protein [Arthrobacter sp. NPDC090010]|uniref:TfoX/Sxy family DNA transformation protein n=1 Tax=Arthrobacter sp. NPDC090010 TaxID=3363942 RepID=UPI0038130374
MSREELQGVVNIGPKLAAGLERIGIEDLATLRERGAVEVWEELRQAAEFDCVHSLLALAGAIAGCRWHELPAQQRAALAEHVRGRAS